MNSRSIRPPRPGQSGFTLVELIVAITLLAIGILSIGQIFAVSARNASFGRTETIAVSLAREIQEKILSESVEQVQAMFNGVDTNDPGTVTVPCTVWAQHLADQLGPTGRGQIWVRDFNGDAELLQGMFSVEIEISWLREGETVSVPVRFAITEIGS
jgi:prepilin-type N-terminal cleavage/methylation domain-containing protein